MLDATSCFVPELETPDVDCGLDCDEFGVAETV